MILFTGTSNPDLGKKIAGYLGMSLGKARFTLFPDGETFVKVEDDIRGRDVYFIQSTCTPVNDSLMELLL